MTKRPKAYSYLRFSTPEQALGDSERRQLKQAQKCARRRGLDLSNQLFEGKVDLAFEDLGEQEVKNIILIDR